MKSCDENQNLMSTLLPLKIVRVPRIAASNISIRKEEYLACFCAANRDWFDHQACRFCNTAHNCSYYYVKC